MVCSLLHLPTSPPPFLPAYKGKENDSIDNEQPRKPFHDTDCATAFLQRERLETQRPDATAQHGERRMKWLDRLKARRTARRRYLRCDHEWEPITIGGYKYGDGHIRYIVGQRTVEFCFKCGAQKGLHLVNPVFDPDA